MLKLVAISPEKIAEIRNALTVISGKTQLALERVPFLRLRDKKDYLEIIRQVDRIDNLLPKIKYEGRQRK